MQTTEYKILMYEDLYDYLTALGARFIECFHLEYKYGIDLSEEKEKLLNMAMHTQLKGNKYPINLRNLRELFFMSTCGPDGIVPEMCQNDFKEYNEYMLYVRECINKYYNIEAD